MTLPSSTFGVTVSEVLRLANEAGEVIRNVYSRDVIEVDSKSDNSPITEADRSSHNILVEGLTRLNGDIPVVSEESKEIAYEERKDWSRFWLIDPLDGTKEFISKNGEFTVNIALVENGLPIVGVVHVPVSGVTYFGAKNEGSFKVSPEGEITRIFGRERQEDDELVIVGSRSHQSEALHKFIREQEQRCQNVRFVGAGSSLKFCLVAEGAADIYPRLAPTYEWDTAAAHVIAVESGKKVLNYETGLELTYNKPSLLNPWFVCG